MKIRNFISMLLTVLLLTSCSAKPKPSETKPGDTSQPAETEAVPENNRQMFDFVTDNWKNGSIEKIYPYLSDEMSYLCTPDTVGSMFYGITDIFGNIAEISEPDVTAADGIYVYSATVQLDNADVYITLSLKDAKIYGFTRDIRVTNEFDITRGSAREHYFLLNGLNAVYTCAEDSEDAPAVLLISGSGPCDHNETVGMLAPLEDIALKLAENGISSLRFEKRTLRFAKDFKATYGIEEEYLADCRSALAYLRETADADEIYLLGHSLGGQIAAALAAEDGNIDGMALLMSSARHLADIACDQYSAADPARSEEYAQFRDAARSQTVDGALGKYYYFGASDAYWASYNAIDTAECIRKAAVPTAIINSTNDAQTFPEDIALWNKLFGDSDNVTLTVYDGMSHFGYKIDTKDTAQLYKPAAMPDELIDSIVQAIGTKSNIK